MQARTDIVVLIIANLAAPSMYPNSPFGTLPLNNFIAFNSYSFHLLFFLTGALTLP